MGSVSEPLCYTNLVPLLQQRHVYGALIYHGNYAIKSSARLNPQSLLQWQQHHRLQKSLRFRIH